MTAVNSRLSTRTQAVVFCGLTIALMIVSAWVTIPVGPVPFTLQTFIMIFAILFLKPRQAILSMVVYILLGAVGLPVFSGMRGGIGMLMGPTGGFLWGFVLGALAAILILRLFQKGKGTPGKTDARSRKESAQPTGSSVKAVDKRQLAINILAASVFLIVMYACGWASMVLVAGFSPVEALLVGIAPFILVDIIKMVAAVLTAEAVKQAIRA